MSEPFVFDPRYGLCKSPFGAAVCGTTVSLHCRPLASEGFTHCALVMRREFSGQQEERELYQDGVDGERIRFSLNFTAPAEPELVWYHFRFWRDDGSGCDLDKTGYRSDGQVHSWQLTVYRESRTPGWFGSGVVYQIFPDRFCRLPSDKADPAGLVGSRWVHQEWSDTPEWRPDPDGEIRNRDFFGGSLRGITSKLPYLADLGVTTLYLNPIFESASNHRYNTADYTRIDPMLGTEQDLRDLCDAAHARGMRVILDGVFNHTGSQSIYFNADGFYPSLGAAQSRESPYFGWYSFHPWPEDYDSWWGIRTLPVVREENPGYVDYIIGAPNSIIRRWLRCGVDGWRLDVADELPDWFIEKIREAMEDTKPDSFLLGEVWEDASNKIAYSQRRRYLLGQELHGVMNYPFRTALLAYLQGGNAAAFQEAMETIRENYPPSAFYSALNFLGTHDTPRILTVLGADHVPQTKEERAAYCLSPAERERGEALLRLAVLVLFSFPGAPMIYYGDEAGMEGFEDPLNRRGFPWGHEDPRLTELYRTLGALRKERPSLQCGDLTYLVAEGGLLIYRRSYGGEDTYTLLNTGDTVRQVTLPWPNGFAVDAVSHQRFWVRDGVLRLDLPPCDGLVLL